MAQRHSAASPPEAIPPRSRACIRCSTSKLKCTWAGEGPCERCARSKAACALPVPKHRGPKRGQKTRVAQLEQKLDGLLSLLTAPALPQQPQPQPQPQPDDAPATTTPPTPPLAGLAADRPPPLLAPSGPSSATTPSLSSVFSGDVFARPADAPRGPRPGAARRLSPERSPDSSVSAVTPFHFPQQQQQQQQQQQAKPTPLPLSRPDDVEIMPGLRITFAAAERALADYRTVYAPQCPFVQLPADTSAAALLHAQPLLFRVLVLVALPQGPQTQAAAKRWVRQEVAQRVVVDELRDVAYLQVVLLSASWFDTGFYINPKTMPLLQLATGLVADLGLTQPANHTLDTMSPLVSEMARSVASSSASVSGPTAFQLFLLRHRRPPHAPDAVRAVLGCYYACALTSALFRRPHVFAFTDYMDRCCDELLEAAVAAPAAGPAAGVCDDALLVALVRLARIVAHIYATLPNPEEGRQQPTSFGLVGMTLAAIRRDLERLWDSQPPHIQENHLFRAHYQAALVRLYEPVLYIHLAQPTDGDRHRQAEALWSCMQASRAFFEEYTAVPVDVMGVLPLQLLELLAFNFVTAKQLALLDDGAAWDGAHAGRSLDLVALGARLEAHFHAAAEYDGQRLGEDGYDERSGDPDRNGHVLGRKLRYVGGNKTILTTMYNKTRLIRPWYAKRGGTDEQGRGPGPGSRLGHDTGRQQPPAPGDDGVPPLAPPSVPASYRPAATGAAAATRAVEEGTGTGTGMGHGPRALPPPLQPPSLVMDVDPDNLTAQGLDASSLFWQTFLNMDTEWDPFVGGVAADG